MRYEEYTLGIDLYHPETLPVGSLIYIQKPGEFHRKRGWSLKDYWGCDVGGQIVEDVIDEESNWWKCKVRVPIID